MDDDALVSGMVGSCRKIMEGTPTRSKLTACFNLTMGVFRLFCVQGDRKWVKSLAKEFHREIMKEINFLAKDKDDKTPNP